MLQELNDGRQGPTSVLTLWLCPDFFWASLDARGQQRASLHGFGPGTHPLRLLDGQACLCPVRHTRISNLDHSAKQQPLTWNFHLRCSCDRRPATFRFRRFRLYSERCHFGSQRSGSGGGPGFSGSKFFGRRVFRFLFRLCVASSPPVLLPARASPLDILLMPAHIAKS